MGLLGVMAGLFVAVQVYRLAYPEDARNAYWRLGAPAILEMSYPKELGIDSPNGLFDLWRGEIWRVVVAAFHHGSLLHLLMNGAALFTAGWLLEPRLGRLRFLIFVLVAAAVSMLPEFLMGSQAVGLSGALCALYGLLFVLRRVDDEVAAYLTDGVVLFTMAFLVGCVVATYLDIVRIANVAHFTGLGYGVIVGEIFYGRWRTRRFRWGFYAAHFGLLPALYFLVHPVWDGNYQWYQALRAEDPAQRRKYFEAANRLDPGLAQPWHMVASYQIEDGELQAAWRTILEGLSYNRSDKRGAAISREIWRRFQADGQRQQALNTLDDVFGQEAPAWKKRLRLVSPPLAFGGLPPATASDNLERFRLDQSIELPATIDGSEEVRARNLNAPTVNPDDPESAALGAKT